MRLYFLIIAIAFSGAVYGYDVGITAGALLFMNTYYQISHVTASLFASSFFWGITTTILFIGVLSDRVGRRAVLRCAPCIVIIAAFYMTYTKNIYGLIAARYCLGIASAIISVNVPLYLSETVSPLVRGRAIAGFQLSICFGILLATVVSLFYVHQSHWQFIFLYELIPALILLIATMIMPESPRWYITKDLHAKAIRALQKLNRSPTEAQHHYNQIIAYKNIQSKDNFIKIIVNNKAYLSALILVVSLCLLNQLTGINSILQYDATILLAAGFDRRELALGSVFVIVSINFVATIISMLYIDKFERKKILRIALFGILISLLSLAIISWLVSPGNLKGLLILIAILTFVVCFALGPGALIWILTAEILPATIRGRGIAFAQCFSSLASATLITIFLPLEKHINYDGIFSLCALFGLLYLTLTYFLPNTKGRTLEEIEKSYLNN